MYEGMIAETVMYRGDGGEDIEAYVARPLGPGPFPSVVVLHHMPGWDEGTKEITRKFAHHGYNAIDPNLYYREGPGGEPDEVAAVARSQGGVPVDRLVGDAEGAAAYLRNLPTSTDRVGIIGFCSGGRQVVIAASRSIAFDAAVDCWGGRVIADADQLTERQPVAPIDMIDDLAAPLLGIFGNDDRSPSPELVDQHEEALKQAGKTYEFHRYDGAGHGFFATDRPGYRPVQATEAWGEVWQWYERYLRTEG
ncbi:MAG TPA: dienelactone hydrolase family protein [Dehalococcoidia bacterium]|nr:dienelactone hydrolase family protein [Dehalococcoidia bacterium]